MVNLVFTTLLFMMAYVPLRWGASPLLRRYIDNRFLISFFVPLVGCLFLPNAQMYLVVVLATFLFTTRDRVDAGCRYVMLLMLLPTVSYSANAGGYLRDFTTADMLAIGLTLKCLSKQGGKTPPLRGFTVEDAYACTIFAIYWLGTNRLPSVSIVLRGFFDQGISFLLPYFALRMSVRSSEDFHRVVACFAVVMGLLAPLAIYEGTHGWSLYGAFDAINPHAGLSKSLIQRGGAMRASVSMSAALILGFVMLLGMVATLFTRPFFRKRWMQAGLMALVFGGLIMTQSRSNLAMLPAGLLIFCLLRRKWGYAVVIGIAGPALFGLLYALAAVSPKIASFLNVDTARSSGDVYDYRQTLLTRGLEEAASHRWTGAALDQVRTHLADIQQGQHIVDLVNTYLTWYLISGLLGMVPIMILFVMIWTKLLTVRLHKLGRQSLVDMRAYAVIALAAVCFQLSVTSFMDRVPYCLIVALVAARVVSQERKRLLRERRQSEARAQFDALPLAPAQQARPTPVPQRFPSRPAPSHG